MSVQAETRKKKSISADTLLEAYRLMTTARAMSDIFEDNAKLTSKYVHATSRGHEAIQLAVGMHLKSQDFLSAYYRDDSILLGIGLSPYELMLQLFAKADDPFSGGRTYYSHPSLNRPDFPKIPHQSSATGMQAIPSAGVAMGLQYREQQGIDTPEVGEAPVVICSIGDAAMTEGEISEAFHMAALKKLPIIFVVQDNEWDISAKAEEIHFADAMTFAKAFPTIESISIDGTDFETCFSTLNEILHTARIERRPFMVHATVPLLGHHTSGVRKEWYRDDLEEQEKRDPLPRFKKALLDLGINAEDLARIEEETKKVVASDFERARNADDPKPEDIYNHIWAPTEVTEEKGERAPASGERTLMVDCALFAIQEILEDHPESLLYGQDVGGRLGGVFREAATLAQKFAP
jgi:2-oxoisovalerate dehydrogenase E1 component